MSGQNPVPSELSTDNGPFLRRPSVSRGAGTLRLRTRLLLAVCLVAAGSTSCGALAIAAAGLLHLNRVKHTHTHLRCLIRSMPSLTGSELVVKLSTSWSISL